LGEHERGFMKNKLSDLQNHLFEMLETLNDVNLKGEKLDVEIKRALAVNELAKTMVANGVLMIRCVDVLYGIPVSDDVPLIPKAKIDDFPVGGNKKVLAEIPRDGGNDGYKRGNSRRYG
jgi:hypothetical protein